MAHGIFIMVNMLSESTTSKQNEQWFTEFVLFSTLQRSWFVRNELVHDKPAPPLEVSSRYLQSYLDSLIGIKFNTSIDPSKGKMFILYEICLNMYAITNL